MISIGLDDFFVVYIMLALLALGVAWGRMLYSDSARGWNLSQENLCQCRKCGTVFLVKRIESVARCPSCEELARVRGKKSAKRMRY